MTDRFKETKHWHDSFSPKNWINGTPKISQVYDRETGRTETAAGSSRQEARDNAVEKHFERQHKK